MHKIPHISYQQVRASSVLNLVLALIKNMRGRVLLTEVDDHLAVTGNWGLSWQSHHIPNHPFLHVSFLVGPNSVLSALPLTFQKSKNTSACLCAGASYEGLTYSFWHMVTVQRHRRIYIEWHKLRSMYCITAAPGLQLAAFTYVKAECDTILDFWK